MLIWRNSTNRNMEGRRIISEVVMEVVGEVSRVDHAHSQSTSREEKKRFQAANRGF
jgi:hypothetical protein